MILMKAKESGETNFEFILKPPLHLELDGFYVFICPKVPEEYQRSYVFGNVW